MICGECWAQASLISQMNMKPQIENYNILVGKVNTSDHFDENGNRFGHITEDPKEGE